jgi:MFS family permease
VTADPAYRAEAGGTRLGRNVHALAAVSFFTDVSSEMIYPLLPVFLTGTLRASAATLGAIEGAAETVAALLKLASGWWSDRVRARKPLVVAGYSIAALARPLMALAGSASQVLAIRLADRVGKGLRGAPRDALIAESVHESIRGRAFGYHRAADHAGAVLGPLIAFAILHGGTTSLRSVFWLAAIPGGIAVAIALLVVRERRDGAAGEWRGKRPADVAPAQAPPASTAAHALSTQVIAPVLAPVLAPEFWKVLAAILIFTLGNSTDAFLLLRASDLGVPIALMPVLWALLHVVKSASSTPGGILSDRIGRRPTVIAGWVVYAAVYLLLARATVAWHAWALFGLYGVFSGLTEGTERALVADLVPAARRGVAFGWYNLTIGIGALPASLIFGAIWDRAGPPAAFTFGASVALVAAVILAMTAVRRPTPLTVDR